MNEGPVDRLPPHILELLALERDAYPEDLAAKKAVLAGVERAVILSAPTSGAGSSGGASRLAGASAGTGGAVAKGALFGKLGAVGIAAFVAGGVVGATTVRHVDAPTTTQPPVTAVLPSVPSVIVSAAPVPPVVSLDDLPRVRTLPEPRPTTSGEASGRNIESSGDLSRERELLDVARAALARGNPEDAIAAATKHEQRWPHGALAEEREVVLIQALVLAGRRADAEQRAAQFRRSFPRSMFAPAITAALEAHPAPADARLP